VPVIAVTALAAPSDREACLEAGMDQVVPKPIDFDELELAIARLCPRRTSKLPSETPRLAAAEVLDQGALLRRVGSREVLVEIAGLFRRDAEMLLRALQVSLDRSDDEGRGRTAHQLKGMLLNLTARRGAALAKDLERGPSADAPERVRELVAEVARVDALLSSLAGGSGRGAA
jgi:two-component system, sensor histidine kinase and response regulator